MIALEHEFEAVCAVGCWRRGVATQRPLWCWRARRRYLQTSMAGRDAEQWRAGVLAHSDRVKRASASLRLATSDGVPVERRCS